MGSVACGLGFVIFVHELGHFLVAKWCGVKCEKFYVGFDVPIKIFGFEFPSKLFHYQWGETEYGIGIIPLGGYVKMLGQDDDPRVSKQEEELARIRVQKREEEAGETGSDTAASDSDAARAQALSDSTAAEGMVEGQTVEQANSDGNFELDPRSFPAKTVPQRMWIISAGVLMNLFFAVIFATCAFRAGVPYTPCEVGSVVAGGPAWKAGIQPGSRIIQVGERGRRSEALRFTWDLRNAGVGMTNQDEKLLLVVRTPAGDEKSFRLKPTITVTTKGPAPTIGVGSASTTKLASTTEEATGLPAIPGTSAAEATATFQGGDVVVEVDGRSVLIEVDGQSAGDPYAMKAAFAARPNDPLTVKVKRTHQNEDGTSRVTEEEAVVQPNPLRRVGLVMKAGPVVSIVPGSIAKEAGFEIGDSIVSIGNQPLGDPMMLPTLLVPHYGSQVEVKVRRGKDEVSLSVDLAAPPVFDWNPGYNSPMVAEALGLAIEVQPKVERVIEGSSAAKELKPGDMITAFKIVLDNPTTRSEKAANREQPQPVGGPSFSWPFVFREIQVLPDDRSLVLSIERSGEAFNVTLKPQKGDGFNPDRGFVFAAKKEIYTAKSWGEALVLGAQRTKEDASRVLLFLRKLVTGQIAMTNVGGPIMIATIAGSEASAGLPRLLIFLTFLSANLAVVNFLPIPALDGGHFIFLCWEGISGKPVNERVQIALTLAGVACLLCLMLFVVVMDIDRLFF
ncbi:MAG: hypothetical protein CMJ64_07475 [Planctomycetaceae bacterium]|nr:hypothetical protein [Planctomycetaceae bacterium]